MTNASRTSFEKPRRFVAIAGKPPLKPLRAGLELSAPPTFGFGKSLKPKNRWRSEFMFLG